MDRRIEAMHVTNTLAYLHLLPNKEQLNELNATLAYIKKFECSAKYIKSLKRVIYLSIKNTQ